ncbi:MAG: di-trans,poly-cis-decaprenylcistransferase [Gammaproteobacteria bacterium]|nr:MAG: di-trans,poly-cis-decaprenylcistransferase [Gammaproteobacteria bacterium]|tara:strand:- start:8109 stop:8816 length:708 start_codon:yes stop_codon:yes gene_type:complete
MSSTPTHVAIIMDGNSRWAKQKNLTQKDGHKAGVKAARNAIEFAVKNNIKHLTLFAFSTENWRRSKKEVKSLMELFVEAMKEETPELIKNSVRANFIGDISRLKKSIIVKIAETKGLTSTYKPKMDLNIAISYGGRWDVLQAVKKIANDFSKNKFEEKDINEKLLNSYLDTSSSPDPDLIIRTGNESRLSNFLIWQAAYSELIFFRKLWPEFESKDFRRALENYKKRKRNFGKRS